MSLNSVLIQFRHHFSKNGIFGRGGYNQNQ